MPMVVKIVGSTPTARTINESEVVVSKHVKSNIWGRAWVTKYSHSLKYSARLRSNKVTAAIAKVSYPLACLILYDLVVQLVRISACHAEGREFESRLDRSYKPNTNEER